jgi:hypothetical protein
MFALHQRVIVNGSHNATVVGFYTIPSVDTQSSSHVGYVIKLDEGFWNADHTVFSSHLVAHGDNLTKV